MAIDTVRFFYQGGSLCLINCASGIRRAVYHQGMPLAEYQFTTTSDKWEILATEQLGSVIGSCSAGREVKHNVYTAYGSDSSLFIDWVNRFNGECRLARFPYYLLGQGYRAYNTVLMRFHSADSWSPFGDGGVNTYAYCGGDPVNFTDRSGHMRSYRDALIYGPLQVRPSRQVVTVTALNRSNSNGARITTTGASQRPLSPVHSTDRPVASVQPMSRALSQNLNQVQPVQNDAQGPQLVRPQPIRAYVHRQQQNPQAQQQRPYRSPQWYQQQNAHIDHLMALSATRRALLLDPGPNLQQMLSHIDTQFISRAQIIDPQYFSRRITSAAWNAREDLLRNFNATRSGW